MYCQFIINILFKEIVVICVVTVRFVIVGRLTSVQEIRPVMYKAMFPMSVNAFVPLRDHSSRPT